MAWYLIKHRDNFTFSFSALLPSSHYLTFSPQNLPVYLMLDLISAPMTIGKENNLLHSAKFLRQPILIGQKFPFLLNSKGEHCIKKITQVGPVLSQINISIVSNHVFSNIIFPSTPRSPLPSVLFYLDLLTNI
jgi:hypothetical protein